LSKNNPERQVIDARETWNENFCQTVKNKNSVLGTI
jgi:hypothetical protein